MPPRGLRRIVPRWTLQHDTSTDFKLIIPQSYIMYSTLVLTAGLFVENNYSYVLFDLRFLYTILIINEYDAYNE